MLPQRGVHVGEDDTLSLEVLTVLVVHHLAVVDDDALGDEVVGTGDLDVVDGSDVGLANRDHRREAHRVGDVGSNRRPRHGRVAVPVGALAQPLDSAWITATQSFDVATEPESIADHRSVLVDGMGGLEAMRPRRAETTGAGQLIELIEERLARAGDRHDVAVVVGTDIAVDVHVSTEERQTLSLGQTVHPVGNPLGASMTHQAVGLEEPDQVLAVEREPPLVAAGRVQPEEGVHDPDDLGLELSFGVGNGELDPVGRMVDVVAVEPVTEPEPEQPHEVDGRARGESIDGVTEEQQVVRLAGIGQVAGHRDEVAFDQLADGLPATFISSPLAARLAGVDQAQDRMVVGGVDGPGEAPTHGDLVGLAHIGLSCGPNRMDLELAGLFVQGVNVVAGFDRLDGHEPSIGGVDPNVAAEAFVLGRDAGEVLALGLGDAQLLVGVLDGVGDVVPLVGLILGRLDVVEDVVEVDLGHVAAPVGHGAPLETLERLEPDVAHPVGLALHPGHLLDDVLVQAALRLEDVVLGVAPPELVLAEIELIGNGHHALRGTWAGGGPDRGGSGITPTWIVTTLWPRSDRGSRPAPVRSTALAGPRFRTGSVGGT